MSEASTQQNSEHQIAEQTIEAAQRHAEAVKHHGKQVEKIALSAKKHKTSNADPEESIDQAELIEQLSQEMQEQGQVSLAHAQALEAADGRSVQDYTESVKAHTRAASAHIAANKAFLAANQAATQNQSQDKASRKNGDA